MNQKQKILAASWERCRQRGMDENFIPRTEVLNGNELELLLRDNQELIHATRPLMQSLHDLVSSSGFVVVLLDAEGYIVEVIGEMDEAQTSWPSYYAHGVKWTEDVVGTSALSLALLGYGPIQVLGREHYCKAFENWTCSAAPLTDDGGKILGVLSVTGSKENAHSHTLGMVVSAAAAISNMIKVKRAQKQLEDTARLHATIINSVSDGLLMINGQGLSPLLTPLAPRFLMLRRRKRSESIFRNWSILNRYSAQGS